MKAFEQQDEIGNFLSKSASSTFSTAEEAHTWMNQCRKVYLASLRKDSNMVSEAVTF